MKDAIGHPLFYTLLTFIIGGAVRALKTLPIPKSALPWAAIGLGLVAGLVDGLAEGETWQQALLSMLKGLASGTGAIAANETLSTMVRAGSPALADAFFGKKAGPSSLPANMASVSVPADTPVATTDGLKPAASVSSAQLKKESDINTRETVVARIEMPKTENGVGQ